MNNRWKWMLAAAIASTLALAPTQADAVREALPAEADPILFNQAGDLALTGIRVEHGSEGRPTVVLETSGPCAFESFVLDGPHRLVIDFPGVFSRVQRKNHQVGRAGVARVRSAQYQSTPFPVARVVFDLEHPVPYEIEAAGSALFVHFEPAIHKTELEEDVPTIAVQQEEPPIAIPRESETAVVHGNQREIEARPAVRSIAEVIDELESRAAEPAAPAAVTESATPVARLERTEREQVAAPSPERPEARVAPDPLPQPRSVEPDVIERLLRAPAFAAEADTPAPIATEGAAAPFQTRTIRTEQVTYRGKRISLNLVDADLKQVFRLFHEISGLNFVLDPEVTGRVTIVLDQVPWDQALDIILKNNGLDKVLENNVLRIATTQKLAREAAARKQLKEAEELEVEPITLTRTLSYAKAEDVQRVIREGGILSARGKVIVDARTNTLIISDVPKKVDPLDALISTLDAETPQVMIEARIVETSRNYTRDLGISWGFEALADASRGTTTGLSFPHNASVRYGLNLPRGEASLLDFSFGNIVDSFTLDLALDALETEGHGRILSSPKIATQNNERAEIEQGVRIPIVNTTATEINVEFVSASLLLNVTPQITAEGTIILDVVVENNSPDFINTAGNIPSIRTQRAQTKVLIEDGGTTVIGGIFVINEGQSEIGVPWFRKLPIFGWLFRSQNITQENRELLIFITPKIVKLG